MSFTQNFWHFCSFLLKSFTLKFYYCWEWENLSKWLKKFSFTVGPTDCECRWCSCCGGLCWRIQGQRQTSWNHDARLCGGSLRKLGNGCHCVQGKHIHSFMLCLTWPTQVWSLGHTSLLDYIPSALYTSRAKVTY